MAFDIEMVINIPGAMLSKDNTSEKMGWSDAYYKTYSG